MWGNEKIAKDKNGERHMPVLRVQSLLKSIHGFCVVKSINMETTQIHIGNIDLNDLGNVKWDDFTPDTDTWGAQNAIFWFKLTVTIPKDMVGKQLFFEIMPDGAWGWGTLQMLTYVNGVETMNLDMSHTDFKLTDNSKAGEKYEFLLHAFTDDFFYAGKMTMKTRIKVVNPLAFKLYYDIKTPLDTAVLLEQDDSRRIDIVHSLNDALTLVDFRLPQGDQLDSTLKNAINYLEEEFYGKICGKEEITATCVGHSHIDVAWLWPLQHTRYKTARTFSTVLKLIEDYPEFVFMSSQPQLYMFLKEDHPELYARVKQAIADKRWEPEGAMWLEADTNLTSGESLIRQILYGKKFFKEEFGVDSKVLWLPDVFGYSGALPQILKKSGIDYFMTTKISWNEYNKLPYDTFKWRGIDGSEVLSHFICTTDFLGSELEFMTMYNGYLCPSQVMGTWQRYQNKDLNRDVLISYGLGDGGGGPSIDMVEQGKRMTRGIPGCPTVKFDTSLNYFNKLNNEVKDNPKLPVWSGELYFEYHRGTYTTVADIKKNNRKSENLYSEIEFFSVMEEILTGNKSAYPRQMLNRNWQTILLNQFHDILPGSSIKHVYDESKKQYQLLTAKGKTALNNSIDNIAAHIKADVKSVAVFNSTTSERNDTALIPSCSKNIAIFDGNNELPSQLTDSGDIIFTAASVPSKGYKLFEIKNMKATNQKLVSDIDNRIINTDFYRLELNGTGEIIVLYDKKNDRDIVPKGDFANRLTAFEDKPFADDAWNIQPYYTEKSWTVEDNASITVKENGPVRTVIHIERTYRDSIIKQDMILYSHTPRIDFVTNVDWQESDIMLKADFPADFNATRATFDIQFGNVERNVHNNTSWDFAQFEVCAHRFADVGEEGYGLSLLNDCKYGYDVKNGRIRLTLLRCPSYPDPLADRGVHDFTYSLFPHADSWKQAATELEADNINIPLHTRVLEPNNGKASSEISFIKTDNPNIKIGTIKKAEDSDEVIIRIYEAWNKRSKFKLEFTKPIKSIIECDLMENKIGDAAYTGNTVSGIATPFEIKTYRLSFN